jgi:hypothetical protein
VLAVGLGCSSSRPAEPSPGTVAAPTPAPAQSPAAAPSDPPPMSAPVESNPDLEAFDAKIAIDAQPGGKKFQGVWLERDDGERWVVAYRPLGWLRAFEGERVHVTGERYQPHGQAIAGTHFRIATLRVVDPSLGAMFVEAGPERTYLGAFVELVGDPGTKGEGERYHVFDAEGEDRFLLANVPEDLVVGRPVTVKARTMAYSPFVAHRGGPMLWILEVEPRP